MSFDPTERLRLGRTDVEVSRLGFGTAEIGGLYSPVPDDAAIGLVRHAWDVGVRYFDTAPLYGYGNAERRLGAALDEQPRDAFALSTKVGRLLVPRDEVPAGADLDHQAADGRDDAFYTGTPPVRVVFDYSANGSTSRSSTTPTTTGRMRSPVPTRRSPASVKRASSGRSEPG